MISQIKNGQKVKKSYIVLKQSNKHICEAVLAILWDEGFILGYKSIYLIKKKYLKVFLKYKKGVPVINSIRLVSKPSLKAYLSLNELFKLNSSQGVMVLSTPQGVMSFSDCKKSKCGGKALLIVN